jgi:hypothetical protein
MPLPLLGEGVVAEEPAEDDPVEGEVPDVLDVEVVAPGTAGLPNPPAPAWFGLMGAALSTGLPNPLAPA